MIKDALVVGINNYQDDRLQNLTAPANDAEAIARLLETHGKFNVWRRPEAKVSGDINELSVANTFTLSLNELETRLVNLFKPEGNNIPDTALFYFSGHGSRKNRGIQEGYLATSDVDFNLGYGLSLRWLRDLLEASPIKQQIILLDCCHSGELFNFNEHDPGDRGLVRDRCFIASSREFESSFEDLNSEYSAFTRVLLEGLNPERTPQKWISNYSLVEYLNQNFSQQNQRWIASNSGSAIDLTCTFDTPQLSSNGQTEGDVCPYKALEYFDFNDEDPKYFYGREKLTDSLVGHVREGNFLAVLGDSGSGKSSVVRAGLLHQLKQGIKIAGSQDWKLVIMLPGSSPLDNLAESWLDKDLDDISRATQKNQVRNLLKQGSEGLVDLVEASQTDRIVLFIDQFEEIFTQCKDLGQREAFLKCLLEAENSCNNKLCIVLTMRIDFWRKCVERSYSGLGEKIQSHLVTFLPMNESELRDAIVKPAERVNLSFESGLVEELIKDVLGSPGSLPLLQYTLSELWQIRDNNELKFSAYSQLGGIEGTLNRRATEVYESLSQVEQEIAKDIFLDLTALGEGTEDTRRRVAKQDLDTGKHDPETFEKVVQSLADKKLIVTREKEEVDVAHEALIRNWKQLRQWLDESRDTLRQTRKYEDASRDWRTFGSQSEFLLSKKGVKEAKEFLKEHSLSNRAKSYIDESGKYWRRESFKNWGLFLIFPLVGSLIAGYFGIRALNMNAHKKLVQDCVGKEICSGRIQALEDLVKAGESLKRFNLSNADLRSVNLSNSDLRSADLSNSDLKSADLSNSDLKSSNLSSSNLITADLSSADLFDADLSSAYLSGADLRTANLFGADLRTANLFGANLTDVKNLSYAQIKSACNWKQAIYKGYWNLRKGWIVNEEENQQFIQKVENDRASDPEVKLICVIWE